MNMPSLRNLLVVVLAIASVGPLAAKGNTTKLTVTGRTLPRAFDVLDSRLLGASNVFDGAFISSPAARPAAEWPRYTVAFHVESPAWMRRPVEVRYVLVYATDPVSGAGFVYIPARGEPGHAVNAGTIERSASEGRWFLAAEAWASVLNEHLAKGL
jgi:hypothetical protein